MAFIKEIKNYTVQFASNSFDPRIWLYGTNGASIGQAVFRPNGSALPADFVRPDGTADLYYHLHEYPMVLDTLRNEKPVYLHFVGSGGGNENAIRTGKEGVGEGDV